MRVSLGGDRDSSIGSSGSTEAERRGDPRDGRRSRAFASGEFAPASIAMQAHADSAPGRWTSGVRRGIHRAMIVGYRDRRTQAFASGERVREFSGFDRQAWRRLDILDAAMSLDDLRALPSNRLERLRGDRAGRFSIRINAQWRLCFAWPDGETGPSDVEIIDYH